MMGDSKIQKPRVMNIQAPGDLMNGVLLYYLKDYKSS